MVAQAIAKNEANYKALFRKAKALGEQGFYEKAVKILTDVKSKSPAGQATIVVLLTSSLTMRDQMPLHAIRNFHGFESLTTNAKRLIRKSSRVSELQKACSKLTSICQVS